MEGVIGDVPQFKKTPELPDDQRFALMKFRRSVADIIKPEHDDYYLLRWLRARKWNVEAAEKMLRTSLKTRAMWNVDNIDKWDCPKVLIDYTPSGVVGFDKEGSPIIICSFAGMDMWGMLHCVTKFEFQKYTVLLLDRYMRAGYESSKKYGPQARQLVVFFDMSNFNLKQYAWRPAAELIITMMKQYEANYPELLKMCYIVNAPKLFSVAFNFVKKFLDEYTMSKINIYKSGSDKWKAQMFSHVDPDVFPKRFGGNLVDENGDPDCKSLICYGGKIPKELYTQQSDENDSGKTFIETTVNKGKKLKLEFQVAEDSRDRLLTWEFRTIDYDIKFGIFSIDNKTGEKTDEISLATVYSNEMDEIGFINCRPNSKYVVVFDNSSSYLRNKKLRYCVELVSDIDNEADEVEELTENFNNSTAIETS